ncbi:methylated-DNA--protein-cysteine methyltransferase [Scheffersomyces xylosifermentans]|uniref:methylated-DNA--protein-cysteine methyltransferase n=1 Tax=Scheffersomyces xylosifermentans TaxID=1304137 RepID=UPI00315CFE90
MKNLFYTIISETEDLALLVVDNTGVLFYASLGRSASSLVEVMLKDFKNTQLYRLNSLKSASSKLVSGKEMVSINETLDKYRQIMKDAGAVDKNAISIPIKIIFGTPLQRKVWDFLIQKLPYGTTTTYLDVAKSLNMPTASRAIANCVGANNIALVIPCHRVIAKSGKLNGYRWGVDIKKKILQEELGDGYSTLIK